MTLPWMLFYGRVLGMSKQEILATRYGEMADLISCFSIAFGGQNEKRKPLTKYEDAILLR